VSSHLNLTLSCISVSGGYSVRQEILSKFCSVSIESACSSLGESWEEARHYRSSFWDVPKLLAAKYGETEMIIIGPKHKQSQLANVTLCLEGSTIAQSSFVKNLGFLFDPMLSFDQHVKSITRTAIRCGRRDTHPCIYIIQTGLL